MPLYITPEQRRARKVPHKERKVPHNIPTVPVPLNITPRQKKVKGSMVELKKGATQHDISARGVNLLARPRRARRLSEREAWVTYAIPTVPFIGPSVAWHPWHYENLPSATQNYSIMV